MSSKKLDRLTTLFESLPPDERKAFTAIVKASVQARGFNLNKLVTAKADDGIECPHCRNIEPKGIVKFGKRNNIQWYRCKDCERTFSGVTGTLWSCTKKDFPTWKTFLSRMMEGRSIRRSAELCKINTRTAFMWRHKILDALAQYHGNQRRMRGIVEADDTVFPLSFKGSTPVGRKAHKRGEPATKPGTSREKVCVSCAIDRNGKVYSKVSALGRATTKSLQNCALKNVYCGRHLKHCHSVVNLWRIAQALRNGLLFKGRLLKPATKRS